MGKINGKDAAVILAAAALALLTLWAPIYDRLMAFSTDLVFSARHHVFGQQHPAATSGTVVIALDELTYRTEPFSGLPKVLWTPLLAKVQDAVIAAGATVVGYDVIFPTSLESHMPGYEKPFLRSLLKHARDNKIVLGQVQHSEHPVAPHPSQSLVVRNQQNIRTLNLVVDVDDVVRRVPLYFDLEQGGQQPSIALELAARASGSAVTIDNNGVTELGSYRIPGNGNSALVNFQGGADIPTYSLADLHACAGSNGADYFAKHFKDKVVLIGGVLDLEDRKLTSKRYMTEQGAAASVPPCVITDTDSSAFERDTIPGVFVLATAVNNLLRQDFLRTLPMPAIRLLLVVIGVVVSVIGLLLRPGLSVYASAAIVLAAFVAGVAALQANLLLPVLPMIVVAAAVYAMLLLYRYMVVDKQKNKIRSLFGLYLERNLVDRMIDSDQLPKLGGELREVTVFYSDMVSFTPLSEGLGPTELNRLMNRYYGAVTDILEAHGGYVWQYAGDAIVAVFGAPLDDASHAGHAVAAALAVNRHLEELNKAGEFGGLEIQTRTGINTGKVVAGNVGSERRFNYTVMGDTVNLAARLEGANKFTKTKILISEEVFKRLPDSIVAREIATFIVKGKSEPTRLFEPLGVIGQRSAQRAEVGERFDRQPEGSVPLALNEPGSIREVSKAFAEAQERYRQRDFEGVIDLLSRYPDDAAAEVMAAKAREFMDQPPPSEWAGVEVLDKK